MNREEAIREAHDALPSEAIQQIAQTAAKAAWMAGFAATDIPDDGAMVSVDTAIMTQVNVITHMVSILLHQWKRHEEPGSDEIQGQFKDTLSLCLKAVQDADKLHGKVAVVNIDEMTVDLVPMDDEMLARALRVESVASGT